MKPIIGGAFLAVVFTVVGFGVFDWQFYLLLIGTVIYSEISQRGGLIEDFYKARRKRAEDFTRFNL